ncbi:MAG: DUF1854 domain-containing protein [Oscillospiraceae bacterium]|nr:DUF1854 domain-containing protein [Oscillospiraceae bacterium]
MNEYKTENFQIDQLRILDVNELHFTRLDSGYLNLEYHGDKYEQVSLTRLQPFYYHDTNISVSFKNNEEEWIEIGIIRDLNEMNEEQKKLCADYLEFRYYVPLLTKIHSIRDNRMGYLFIDAETTAGRKRIAVNDWWTNFRLNNNGILTVTDADGNKYYVPHPEEMDKKSYRRLELFM